MNRRNRREPPDATRPYPEVLLAADHHAGGDVRDLLGMNTRSAYLVAGLYLVSLTADLIVSVGNGSDLLPGLAVLIMVALGSLSALGYGPLAGVTVFGMQFLDFFDFLTNSVMMPIAAIAICLLVSRVIGVQKIEEEVTLGGKPFRRKKIFNFMIQYLCPIFAAIILISSVANALGWIAM